MRLKAKFDRSRCYEPEMIERAKRLRDSHRMTKKHKLEAEIASGEVLVTVGPDETERYVR